MLYLIYKTTNQINEKIYIGCHKTKDIDDGYLGSGKILKRAIEKYGIENFSREIIEVFDNPNEMFDMEAVLVNKKFVEENTNYNLKIGGEGGFDFINKNDKRGVGSLGYKHTTKTKEMFSDQQKERMKDPTRMAKALANFEKGRNGKAHTEETKRKIGKANSKHQKGKKNSQYGTCWINNGKMNKKIEKEQLTKYLTEGWIKGRKMNL